MIVQIIGWFALVIFVLGLIASWKNAEVDGGRNNLALLLIVAAICFK